MSVSPPSPRKLGWSLFMAISVCAACGDDGPSANVTRADAATSSDAATGLDSSVAPLLDAAIRDASELSASDAASADAQVDKYVPPTVVFPTEAPSAPFLLSQVGLYREIASKTLAPDLIAYEPSYTLWSDGADKARHLRLPAGTQIDTSDMDHWQFPVGTVLFKEFALSGKKLETRVVARTGTGARDYFFGAFVWRDDESDAELAWDGAMNVRDTMHDVPTVKQCGTCHNGEPGRVLGFSAVQTLSQATGLLQTPSVTAYAVPGNAVEAQALGYLHANCGHCHNPNGSSRPDTDLNLRLSVAQQRVVDTNAYASSVGVKLQSFQGSALTIRIVAGQPEQSGLYFRMSQRGPLTQMPPIATELADTQGLASVSSFIAGIPP